MSYPEANLSPVQRIALAEDRITIYEEICEECEVSRIRLIDWCHDLYRTMQTVKSLPPRAKPIAVSHETDPEVFAIWIKSTTNAAYFTALEALYKTRVPEVKKMREVIFNAIKRIEFDTMLIEHLTKYQLSKK